MKIGIDARLYGVKHGGIGRYTQELIRNLLTIDPAGRDYVFFVYSKKDEEQIRADIPAGVESRVRFVLAPYRCYTLAEQIFMPLAIARAKVSIMHFTHFNVPLLFNTTSLRRRGRGGGLPFVVTIHDLIIHRFPNERATTLPKWLYKIKLWGYKKVIRHAVEKASAIIVPTEFGKRDLLEFYAVPSEKVKVVYEGVTKLRITNYELRITGKKDNQNSKSQLKIKNLAPYLLYVGSFYPHKNIERLIDAFHILRIKYNLDINLVLVGKKDYFQEQIQKYVATSYKLQATSYLFYGRATDAELAELYQNAAIFVFPSLYEGFGLPPMEAMSFGVPVVASNASCIPEVCGDAAFYFNPRSADDMAEKINEFYTNRTLQNELRERGFSQIKKYSWQRMTQETVQFYKNFKIKPFYRQAPPPTQTPARR